MPKAAEGENDAALQTDYRLDTLFNVRGKVALVTGGGSGIGAMIAAGLCANGAKVFIASRKDCSEFASQLNRCVAAQCDVSDPADVARLVQRIDKAHGKLDILVNNSGTNYSAPMGKQTAEMFDKVLSVNVRSVFMLTQAFEPLLKAAGTPESPSRVINIASIFGIRAPVQFENYSYSTSKAAVRMLTEHMAPRLGKHNVLVTSVCPGPFVSRMMRAPIEGAGKSAIERSTAVGRLGAPRNMAATVLYLCGPGGDYVTGSHIVVDGGAVAKM